jgi:hypothetical protein
MGRRVFRGFREKLGRKALKVRLVLMDRRGQ